jgi:transcription factor RLM1
VQGQNKDAYDANRDRAGDGPGARRNDNIETPISALPSRYMSNELLPSPSNFFSEWGDWSRGGGTGMSAVLPSPMGGGLGFGITPRDEKGSGWNSQPLTEGLKRKGSEDNSVPVPDESKKVKT